MIAKRSSWNLLKTSTFRLAAVYLLVFGVSVGAILGYVYWSTLELLERQTDDAIAVEIRNLAQQYQSNGLRGVRNTIRQRSAIDDGSVYLLTNSVGRWIAGNLRSLPASAVGDPRWIEFTYTVDLGGEIGQRNAKAFYTPLTADFRLLVGRDIEDNRRFTATVRNTVYWALGIALLLGLGGGLLTSRNFLRRVEAINATSRSIMAGNLSERVTVTGTGDELDRLSAGLNGMLDQIERLMAGMREVSTNVAHDLRSPLTRLRARAESALRSDSSDDQREALQAVLEEADELLSTFNALLSIARAEAGQSRESFSDVKVSQLLTGISELYEPMAEEAGGTLKVETTTDAAVHADRQLLAQAITNLVDNAFKYGGDPETGKPHIRIRAERRDDLVAISVSDSGPGIPAEDRDRVKDRFVRLEASRNQPGNGLGLSLVNGVMTLHGGELQLSGNGNGLTATLLLPVSTGA